MDGLPKYKGDVQIRHWKGIPGYPNYFICEHGFVYSTIDSGQFVDVKIDRLGNVTDGYPPPSIIPRQNFVIKRNNHDAYRGVMRPKTKIVYFDTARESK